MRWVDLKLRVRAIVAPRRVDRELEEELQFHIERDVHELVRSGAPPAEARRRARVRFGSAAAVAEACRDARGTRGIESLVADLQFGVRYFAKRPRSAIAMLLVFALGVGVNTALFLFIYSLVNGPLPGVPADASVVRIRGIDRTRMPAIGREFSYPEYQDYAAQDRLFSSVAAWTSSDVTLGVGAQGATLLSGAATYVTPGYLEVLGIRPVLGAGRPRAALISHALWERHFQSAPDIVGRTMKVNNTTVTIGGVLPRRFIGARTGGSPVRVWLPLEARPEIQRATPIDLTSYDDAVFGIVARLRPGVGVTDTLPTVRAIAARAALHTARARSSEALSTDVVTLRGGNYFPPGDETPNRMSRIASFTIPFVILLITCTSVSTLQAGLAMARRREIAVRLSLGAPRRRIVRQLLTESVLLACAAGAVAVFTIWVLWRLFDSSVPDIELAFDWPVFLFSFGVAVAAGLIFGVSPALHATRLSVATALKEAHGTAVAARSRLQSTLVVAQIAFTQPALLLVGAILLSLSADLRTRPDAPFADRVVDVRFNTNPRYGSMDERREAALHRLRDRLAGLPGVVAVVPQAQHDEQVDVAVHAADAVDGIAAVENVSAQERAAPAGYLAIMGWPVVRGRDFQETDRLEANVALVTTGLARRLWRDGDALGRRIVASDGAARRPLTVVGVVDDAPAHGRGVEMLFVPGVRVISHFLIRTRGPAEPLIQDIRAAAAALAPELPITRARTLATIGADERRSVLRGAGAAGGAGLVALFLTAIGLYAVVAFAVNQRVREIGIRGALGATGAKVVGMFLSRGLRLAVVGSAIGLTLSLIAVRLLSVTQGSVPPEDTTALAAVIAVVMIAVAMVATWIPARRAARVDPMDVLRAE